MATMNIPDFAGTSTAVEKPNANGRAAAAASRPVVLSTEDKADLAAIAAAAADTTTASPIKVIGNDEYETVAASTTAALGATGATGDRLSHVLIIPATTSPGAVQIKDGSGSAITIFAGGASSVSNLVPFAVPLGLKSLAGAWSVITGANVSAIGVGDFT